MTGFKTSRRDVLRATGLGLFGLTGLSTLPPPAASHGGLEVNATDLLRSVQVPADSDAGFEYPYYLYVPESTQTGPVPMLVEPNNTGTATDDFEQHRDAARKLSRGEYNWTRTYSEALAVPLLVPAFPRPRSDPVDGLHYVHALDEQTMRIDSGPLERVDLQLRRMVEHAQELLRSMSYPIADDIMLNGFSASGNFVNRFTALHPDIVRSVTAGGVNGTLILPLERAKGHTLDYHIGVADLEEITGERFDIDEWRDVSQLIYMGSEDENDTIPYDDAWSDQQRAVALDVYGEDMQDDRMPYCEGVYDDAGADAQFRIYEGVGHRSPIEIQRDVVAFHREASQLKQLSFRNAPAAGDRELTFDALVHDGQDQFDLRVRSDSRGDVTDSPATVTTGESTRATVSLTTPVEADERLSAVVVPTGVTDPDEAVVSATRRAVDPPSVTVLDPPTVDSQSITVRFAVESDYQTESPLHLYFGPATGPPGQLLETFPPGTATTATYEVDTSAAGASLDPGTRLRAQLRDVESNGRLAVDTFTVADDDGSAPATASVAFESQPTAQQDSLTVSYAVDSGYEPTTTLTLQIDVGSSDRVLLDAIEPGSEATETFSLQRIPVNSGEEITVRVVDRTTIAQDRTVVVRDTEGAVALQFTDRPTDDDPTATVRYTVDDSYQTQDAITLRAYSDGLPGTVSGEALALLSPGDSGMETFTVGEDVAQPSGELLVAVVDDVPLALASAADASQAGGETASSGREGSPTPTATDRPTAEQVDTDSSTDTETTVGADGPGFGIGSALASVGGLSYLLKRRLDSED